MLVDTQNIVTVTRFRRELDRYVLAAKKGVGPVVVTDDSEVVGYFLSPEDFESLCDNGIAELLASRENEPTISTDEVRKRVAKAIKRASKKSKSA